MRLRESKASGGIQAQARIVKKGNWSSRKKEEIER